MKTKNQSCTIAAIMILSLLLTLMPLLGIQSVQSQAPLPGTVSYWMFDEGVDGIAYDSVDGNDGTLMNGVEWTTGVSGSALSFRRRSVAGVFEHVLVPDAPNLNLVNEVTIEFWIKPTADIETQPGLIFGKGTFDDIPEEGPWWGTNTDNEMGLTTQLQYDHPTDVEVLFTPGILQADEWQHITWRFDSGNLMVYRNAQLYAEAQFPRDYLPDVTGQPFMFGFTEEFHATYFDLDEFVIYNRALTDEEIQERYQSLVPRPPVNVTVSCYDITGAPLYLASVIALHPEGHYGLVSGYTDPTGVFHAPEQTLPDTIDLCVSWGNASAPGYPGYHMFFRGIDATGDVELVADASDLRAREVLAHVTLTLENITGPMDNTRVFMGFSEGFPTGAMGPITDANGEVTLYLANGTDGDAWAPDPPTYTFVLCQMVPTNNVFFTTDMLVTSDLEATILMPDPGELNTIGLTFYSPSGPGDISLMSDLRLFFEFPGMPTDVSLDDLLTISLPTTLHGNMLFAVPAGPGGAYWFPVAGDGTTSLCADASTGLRIAAIYTNTSAVSGGPWMYIPMKEIEPLPAGASLSATMGGGSLRLNSVTATEAYVGSTPTLTANFTDAYDNPLIWIAGDGSTSIPTPFPGIISYFAVYNITIEDATGTWYDGQAQSHDPMSGSTLNGVLSGIPSFPDLTEPGTYSYSIFIDTGPWPMDPPGVSGDPLEGTFEVDLNAVAVEFMNHYIYRTPGDSSDAEVTGAIDARSQINNTIDSGLDITEPYLTFENTTWISHAQPDDLVSINPYIWKIRYLPENETEARQLSSGPVVFEPGFTASRTANQTVFTETWSGQNVTVTVTPTNAMDGLIIYISADHDLIGKQITSYARTPDEGTVDEIYDNGAQIGLRWSIPSPTVSATYTLDAALSIELQEGFDSVHFEPIVVVTARWPPIAGGEVAGDSVSRSTELGTWTWNATGEYMWHWFEMNHTHVVFGRNDVTVDFDTAEEYSTHDDVVPNVEVTGYKGAGFTMQNSMDATRQPVVAPYLTFITPFPLDYIDDRDLVSTDPYIWQLRDLFINEDDGRGVGFDGSVSFTPGSAVSRSMDPATLTAPGGTQDMTLEVTVQEPMNELLIQVNVQDIDEHVMATITAPTTSDPDIILSEDGQHLWIHIREPIVGATYIHTVTLEVGLLLDPFTEVAFRPTVAVSAINETVRGMVLGDTMSWDTEVGTWTWNATGEYSWRWTERHSKGVHLQGYAEYGEPVVGAWLGRYRVYVSDDYREDTISGMVTGYLRSRYDIRPEGDITVEGARIEVETPFGPETFPHMYSHPEALHSQVYDDQSGAWTYAWEFGALSSGQGAMVSLPTIFNVPFDPGFNGQRLWNPWITADSVTQPLTLEFTPTTIDFHNVHVSVRIPKTEEASPTIDYESISVDPPIDERDVEWRMWVEDTEDHIAVNWNGDPISEVTYTFSVDVTVQNMLFPDPILYKPAAGFGANFDWSWAPPDTPHPTIAEDINRDGFNESLVTYYGTGDFEWQEYAQWEHAVSLSWISAPAPLVWMEYNTGYWYSTTDDAVANDVLEGMRDGWANAQYAADGSGIIFAEPMLNLELTDGLTADRWSEDWWIEGTQYRWEFPDLEGGQGAGADVTIAGPFLFTPDFEVSRTLTPRIIMYPGGIQEFNFTFTPIDATLNGVHFHINLPESELFDARIIAPTTDPENNIWLSEDQRHLWIQRGLEYPADFHPHTFTVKIQVTMRARVAIRFVPTLHVDARTYSEESEWIGSSPPPSTTEIGTWTWSSAGDYLWRWQDSHARNVVLEGSWEVVPFLTVRLAGEFDYLEEEKVKIRVTALVTDAQTGEPVSDADVTLNIYDETGTRVVPDYSMAETVVGTGIYEWLSRDTIKEMAKADEFLKGVYLVHVQASLHGGPVASAITQVHVDPPAEDLLPVATLIVAIMALASSIVTPLILLKRYSKRRTHRAQAQP